MEPPIGLIAGSGELPLLTARGIRESGRGVACVGLYDQFENELPDVCDHFAPAGILALGKWSRLLRRWGAREAVMIGGVRKATMYHPLSWLRQMPDWRAANIWYRRLRHDRRSHMVLTAVADELASNGVRLIDSTQYIPDHLATPGPITAAQPSARQQADIAFGWPILMRMSDLDIGQAIAVRDRDVIAVEAMEGTDAMIRRVAELCPRGGWVLLKGAGERKDMRFDVPTIGLKTIEGLKAAGGTCIALAAGRVIIAEKPKAIEAADAAGIVIVGCEMEQ